MSKKKISRFEYAITEICDPDNIHNYEAYTEAEERQQRIKNLNSQLGKIRTKDGRKLTIKDISHD
ncbi:hypothetical protein [Croceimicrobium sp.]|uniref:hypothetical protein n=1 Tax=Croceimicrobium sp. TaxID=2828340 RepID=UPI003BAA13CD